MNTNNKPVEYQGVSFNRNWKQDEIVEARIKKALEDARMINVCDWYVRVVQVNFSKCFTRVYIGSYGTDKVMLSSKADQSIDMGKVIKQIRLSTKWMNQRDAARDLDRNNRDSSGKIAGRLNKKYDLSYSSELYLNETSTPNLVEVKFKKNLTEAEAEKVIAILKTL